jgi:muramoyltetrapeptide carboxypeptidase
MTVEPAVVEVDPSVESAPVRVPGIATGVLLGGNLSLLVSTVGTPDMPDLSGAILLLEDVSEAPYKVDRMLTHLRRAGALRGLAGVALGHFTDCEDKWPTTIVDVLGEHLGSLGVPVLGGLPIGHGTDQLTVALGTLSTLDADAGILTVEAAGQP